MRRLAAAKRDALLATLQTRFERHSGRHRGLTWAAVEKRLEANPAKLWSLAEMERTGGEPDIVGRDAKTGGRVFTYHNGAESYYAARGFRGVLRV
jgi:hypothetical protein